MGSDYSKAKIASWEMISDVRVPLDRTGEYLNWEEVSADGKEAERLTDPYGVLMYSVGGDGEGGDFTVFFDFAELPDGRIALDAVWDSDSAGTIDSFGYDVVQRDEATAAALAMCDRAIEICADNEVDQGEDPYAFARAVAEHCGGTMPVGTEPPPWDELRVYDDDPEAKTIELVFYNDCDTYVSETYGVAKGETPVSVAWEVCRRFGWDKARPGSTEDSDV